MLKFFYYLFLALLISITKLVAQGNDKSVAKVGDQKISEREFKIRYELVPHYSRDQLNEDSSKIDLLNSIIAEKLLAQEANSLGFDTTDYYKYSIQQIRDLYVRDALYLREIDSKVKISQNDIQEALTRRAEYLSLRIISTLDSSDIFNYYSLLLHGAPFDSIAKISDPVEYDSNKAPIKITYGQMQNDNVEDTLYSLKVGQFSSPVKTQDSWFIFKLLGISSEVPPNANDPNFNRTIINIIRMRKSRIIGMKFLDGFNKNKRAIIDSTLFLQLAEKISLILTKKESNKDFGRDNKLFLNEGNIMQILNDFGETINNENIVNIENKPITLKEYLYSLVVYPILINDPSFKSVAYYLMTNLNQYIQFRFLSDEGYKEALQYTPDVKENISIWSDNFLAKMLKNTFRDSINVSDEDVKNYYKEHKEFEKLNILEILDNKLETIEIIFKELKSGKDFRELAKKYSQSIWTSEKGGEIGYLAASELGEIGIYATKLKLNQVYGPIKTDSGYSVIKLIGRKVDSTRTNNNFESIKSEIKDELLNKEFNKKFFDHLARLADNYKYSINYTNLKKINVLDIPMFTYKYIGFGGRIAAMPFLDAWYDWVKYLNNKTIILP